MNDMHTCDRQRSQDNREILMHASLDYSIIYACT